MLFTCLPAIHSLALPWPRRIRHQSQCTLASLIVGWSCWRAPSHIVLIHHWRPLYLCTLSGWWTSQSDVSMKIIIKDESRHDLKHLWNVCTNMVYLQSMIYEVRHWTGKTHQQYFICPRRRLWNLGLHYDY